MFDIVDMFEILEIQTLIITSPLSEYVPVRLVS